ncbi:MAG: AAA family ATPase [Deltaproteobacteria bacterium]|nr:AAA family ATPase [Deltaproteobacteria bacterium]
MYCNHYGFSEKPFDVTPDPRFLYLSEGHRETLASIVYGIQERRGFITVIGEVGTGKTTLLKAALDRLDEKTSVAFIFNTDVTFDQMLIMALYEWGLVEPKEKLPKVDALQRLNHFAIEQKDRGGNVVLIVDEAQNLDNMVMENLRLLSNLETRRHKLIQIVLSGQPELDTKLNRHELRQFAQRISLRRYVFPFDEKDTYAYLQHRLQVVKDKNSSPFTGKVQKLIWEYSGITFATMPY